MRRASHEGLCGTTSDGDAGDGDTHGDGDLCTGECLDPHPGNSVEPRDTYGSRAANGNGDSHANAPSQLLDWSLSPT